MDVDSKAVARELNEWFQSVLQLADASLFGIAPEGPHRDAVVLDALRRNARIVYDSKVEPDGKLYSPLCFFLAAACRQLHTSLGAGHWRAALDNIGDLQQRLANSRSDSAAVGLDIGTPATLFKAEFDEAIRQAGLVDGTTFLGKEDRQVALGLAINWGIRFLLAYAVEARPSGQPSERRDLSWLAGRVSPD
ncbi:hypothetical protein [uncultured Paludibaculum sp.]|uniref:hypothetical protein n=1 Tax=uncultured Paludibaculum sp. TaxID=1765020 RepID=UPI002AABC116|nr:hypothetical protein [uncultured Paludibaculum sp.]